jgi:hypothetical protein
MQTYRQAREPAKVFWSLPLLSDRKRDAQQYPNVRESVNSTRNHYTSESIRGLWLFIEA